MNLKKLFATSAILTLAVSTFGPAINGAKANFGAELLSAYSYAHERNVTTLPTVESAYPMGKAIRAHTAKMMSNWALAVLNKQPNEAINPVFTDIAGEGPEMQGYIIKSAQQGLMGQGIEKFMPQQDVTRAQFGTVLSRALFGNKYDGGTPYYANHLANLKKLGIMNDLNNPERPILRYEIWLMLQRAEKLTTKEDNEGLTPEQILGCLAADDYLACIEKAKDEVKEDKKDDKKEEVNIKKEGNLSVMLSKNTPSTKRLPKGAQGVKVVTFTVEAGKADVDLISAKVSKGGMGVSAVSDVAFFTDRGRVSKARNFNSDDEATVIFSPALTVKRGEKINLTAVISTSKDASNGAQFYISLDDLVTSAKDIDARYPIKGDVMEIGTIEATQVKVSADGSVPSPKLGQQNAIVAKFKIDNETKERENVTIKAITLKEEGSANQEDFANFTLWNNGKEIASTKSMNGKYLSFELKKEVTIDRSKTEKFVVKADIVDGANKDFAFILDKGLDLDAEASKFGYVSIDNQMSSIKSPYPVIKAGAISIKTINPENTEILKDKDNVELGGLDVMVNAGKDLELQKFTVYFNNVVLPAVGNAGVKEEVKFNVKGTAAAAGNLIFTYNGVSYNIPVGVSADSGAIATLIKNTLSSVADSSDVLNGSITVTAKNAGNIQDPIIFANVQGVTVTASVTKQGINPDVATLDKVLDNVELYDGISVYDLKLEKVNNTTYKAVNKDINISLKDGKTTKLRVRADIEDVNVSGLTFNLQVQNMGSAKNSDFYVVELGNDVQVTDIVPNTITMKKVEGEVSAATITGLPLTVAKNAVVGSKDVVLSKFQVQAGKTSDLEIKDITFGATYLNSSSTAKPFDNTVVSQVKLYKNDVTDNNLVATKSSADLVNGKLTFDNINVEVKKDQRDTFFVTVDIVDDSTNLPNGKITAMNLSQNDFVIEDQDNDTITATVSNTASRVVTLTKVGTITANPLSSVESLDKPKDIVAGDSAIVAGFETTVQEEPALVKELQIGGLDVNAIEKVVLLDRDLKEIATQPVVGPTVDFNNLSLTLNEGTDKIYVKLKTNLIGKNRIGKTVTGKQVTMTINKIEGKDSGKDINNPGLQTASSTFNVVPVAAVVSSFAKASSNLAPGIAIANIKLSKVDNQNTDANGVSLKTYFNSLKLKPTTLINLDDVKVNLRKKGSSTNLLSSDQTITANTEFTLQLPNTVSESDKLITSDSEYEVVVTEYTVNTSSKNASLELTLENGTDKLVLSDKADLSNAINILTNNGIGFGVSIEAK